MEKFKSGVFATTLIVSMAVGALSSLVVILVDDILVLPLLFQVIVGAIVVAIVAGFAFLPLYLQVRKITDALTAINSSKRITTIQCLPFGVLRQVTQQTNTLIESQVDFQSMRGRLYEQISEVAAQEERNRLARDLHDSIKQQVFSMSVSAAAAHAHLEQDIHAAKAALLDVRQSAQEAMVEMRVLLQQLAPAPLEQSGLVESMRQQMEALSYRTGAQISTEFDKLPANETLPIGAQETLFRVAQEALSNIARHARARHVALKLKHHIQQDTITLSIIDDGQGFDMETIQRGMGLNNMERRVEDLDAEITMSSAVGKGTQLMITVPLERKNTLVDEIEKRAEYKKLAEDTYHQYLGLMSSLAGIIFALTLAARTLSNNSPIWVTILMGVLSLFAMFGMRYFWKRYQPSQTTFSQTVPSNQPAHPFMQQHIQEGNWIVLFAMAFVIPGSFIGIENLLWLPALIGGVLTLAIFRTLFKVLKYQHDYFSVLLPSEMPDAMRTLRTGIITSTLAVGFVALTVVLPGTSSGLYLRPTDTDQWDSNFFTGMLIVFVVYVIASAALYWLWYNKNKQSQSPITEQIS